jgi:hypothetical protein
VSIRPADAGSRQGEAAAGGACLACEAVVSKAKDWADSLLCHALGREETQVLTQSADRS